MNVCVNVVCVLSVAEVPAMLPGRCGGPRERGLGDAAESFHPARQRTGSTCNALGGSALGVDAAFTAGLRARLHVQSVEWRMQRGNVSQTASAAAGLIAPLQDNSSVYYTYVLCRASAMSAPAARQLQRQHGLVVQPCGPPGTWAC